MRDAAPTADEVAFLERVTELVPSVQDWYHADEDGTPWMTVSYDDKVDGGMRATWRLDFDGIELVAGRSPGYLNWDDGVRGRATGMSLEPPEGLTLKVHSVEEAAHQAAEWFHTVTDGRASRQTDLPRCVRASTRSVSVQCVPNWRTAPVQDADRP